ncbi:MAG: Uma2 family endonuclease [Chloroflexota bacterium]|nr:Uma2 family endonuclease [Chloroflexota bacterium]
MEVKKRLYTVDDVLELQGWDGNRDRKYELINGELREMSPANMLHAWLASRVDRMIGNFAEERELGYSFVEGGYFLSDDRHNLYAPDVAFVSKARMPDPIPQKFAGFMPDLAVEIASPSNTVAELHSKALIYLRNGTQLVWILYPVRESAEVCRLDDEANLKAESFGIDVPLSGEDVLPGFELDLRRLFKR